MPKTLFLGRDDSGIFLFTSRPVFEKELGGPDDVGIWSESSDGEMILQMTVPEASKMFGFAPDNNCCYDVTVITTLVEKADA